MTAPKALVSIHDVMPETLVQVEKIYSNCQENGISTVTLLVVPGKQWGEHSIKRVQELVSCGAVLAGHGWEHYVDPKKFTTLNAKLHSALLSRNVAEHLVLDANGIKTLITRCYQWFNEHDLPSPELYVPPAWAMGNIARAQLKELPFRYHETFFGLYDTQADKFTYSPLTGYEADTVFRAISLRFWNQLNLLIAQFKGPLRIGIHPYDFDYKIANDLQHDLKKKLNFVAYGE